MQDYYMTFLKDIPFNFLIAEGLVYEGRGFVYQGEIPSNESLSKFDNVGIIIAFIGTFNGKKPSERQNETFFAFLEDSVSDGFIKPNFTLLVQSQLIKSEYADGLIDALKPAINFYEGQNCDCETTWSYIC